MLQLLLLLLLLLLRLRLLPLLPSAPPDLRGFVSPHDILQDSREGVAQRPRRVGEA
ncbi:MAG: hypothetical protein H0T76_09650 [Nannocystis sp.]|nr:hypothetical protein [Nannocystis sp.]MBA3546733.1 hypothetical protein [Nannocystis sp.]